MKTSDAASKPSAPATGTPQDRFAAVLGRSNNHVVPIHSGMLYSNLPARPNLTATTTRNPPSGHAANRWVGKNDNNGSGGNGPALPPPFASATQWLSYECQRRHFNPEFNTMETRNKAGEVQYQCTVKLQDLAVHSDTQFDNAVDAKVHVADKAVKQLRCKWPRPGPNNWRRQTSTTTNNNFQVKDSFHRQEDWRQQSVHRHQSKGTEVYQPGLMAPSSVDMTDPTQARAFVEGFKMGQVASQRANAKHGSLPPRTKAPETGLRYRSRSPAAYKSGSHGNGARHHRYRSPLRGAPRIKSEFSSPPRYHTRSRHDHPLPLTDRYRPCHSDVEDQHGRLRDFDKVRQGH